MFIFTGLIIRLNAAANALFRLLHRPMSVLPSWLSLTIISIILGVVLLLLFKYTSNQPAIGHVRDKIKAHLLSMKLFKDNIPVVLKSQMRILLSAFLLLAHSFCPMLVMIIPFSLLLGQLGLWYQSRPLRIEEQAILVMQLAGSVQDPMPLVSLEPSAAAVVTAGPVRVPSKRQVYWEIQTKQGGYHQLTFQVEGCRIQKELTVGDGMMSVSTTRPGLDIVDLILHPAEKPLERTSPVRSISITYPDRSSRLSGTDVWMVSLFIISMAVAFIGRPFFNVKF